MLESQVVPARLFFAARPTNAFCLVVNRICFTEFVTVLAMGFERRAVPPLAIHVEHVLCVRSNKQVAWINAWRIVAVVTDRHA